ncbi:twin-arginine translocation signal domain-containing protein [Georgenia sp. 311]|uniref:Twin-arginine translocation signal domain-containing protein n=1 Tax=Georgenia wutianyii TaxID=2585135 RepID=A0ABX5VJV3_9MICO|nr:MULTISPECIES: DMSO/selenate family reductase complex A subunit [Georgenia]QDB78691.1 twin-arginine translocation signal domain-containing protein [Georgenia wutianyii]TNC17327.1 twin-arginine translocation signal domain-containing protein [Georgenia sp. 311]
MVTPQSATTRPRPSRRTFLKWSAATGGAAALVSTAADLGMPGRATQAAAADGMPGVDATVWNACLANCQSRCPLRLQVKDGTVVRVLPDSTGSDEFGDFNIRACVRGRNQRERIYSPDRIKTPVRRTGPRGSGQWEAISWEEALDTIASQMRRVKETYGNEALWYHYGSGSTGGNITKRGTWPRLLNTYGGYLGQYGDYSTAQITAAFPYQYGGWMASNSLEDAQNSRLQVMFGNNPLETRMSGGGELAVVQKVRAEFGVRTIVIDPRYSETALAVADEWVPVRPGTDAALVAGMIHVMLAEDLHDQAFLDRYCVGFDEDTLPEGAPENSSYRSYIEGKGPDGVEKTPEWAAGITGVPAARIRQLARDIATAKPCAITQGWGSQRHANGENVARAVFTLAAATGNIGIPGGGNGAREGNYSIPVTSFPLFDGEAPPVSTQISCFNWIDAIDHGPEMTAVKDGVRGKDRLDVGIKLMIVNSSNTLINQHNDVHVTQETLRDDTKCEFIVVIDHQWTPSCDWGDIVLPATTNFEENDLIPGASCSDMGWSIIGDKAIEPLYESKTGYEMCTELARRLGIEEEFTQGRTQEEWRTWLFEQTRETVPDFPTEDELREMGVFRKKNPDGHVIGMKAFREDPEANPLATPSGKIEIFSQQLYEMSQEWVFEGDRAGDRLTALPEHLDTWEGALEARTSTFPLQCIAHHYKGRTHSSYANLPRNLEAHPQMLWINPQDAEARGVANGDTILVFNDRGTVRTQARVTPRIAPGVVSLPQGAWYTPDKDGVDVGGNVNTLMKYHPSPLAKGNPGHTALVDVRKA